MKMKERMERLETQMMPPPVDRARVEANAQKVLDDIERLSVAFRTSGQPALTEAERLSIGPNLAAFMAAHYPRKGNDA